MKEEIFIDVQTVMRIVELTERRCHSAAFRLTPRGGIPKANTFDSRRIGMINEPSSEFEGAESVSKVVDKLTLIKAYETTLRN